MFSFLKCEKYLNKSEKQKILSILVYYSLVLLEYKSCNNKCKVRI